jgi:hypothetical protein
MDYLESVLARLTAATVCGYHRDRPAAAEPTALAALALVAHRRADAARPLVERLLTLQQLDGSVGIEAAQTSPGWATGLAVLAWRAAQESGIVVAPYVGAIDRALDWLLATAGTLPDRVEVAGRVTMVRGWPWVAGTYSWVEPTAIGLLALKHTSYARHARAREAALLLVNRLLESGGCNYGNTVVFGQTLRPHVQPSGLALLALAGEDDLRGRIARTLDYLRSELSERTTTASLCYGLLGLAAHDAFPKHSADWLRAAAARSLARNPSAYNLALLALASLGPNCPLIARVRSVEPEPALEEQMP